MVGDVEALGGLTTAGLVASIIERSQGEAGEPHGVCANCGTAIAGRYCHQCGQPAHIHRSVGHLIEEFTHGIWHFDTKAWRTLPELIFHPGRLTRAYIDGKRARYVAPLAMFLFTIFLMFFVFGLIGGPAMKDDAVRLDTPAAVGSARQTLADAKESMRDVEVMLGAAKADAGSAPGEVGRLEGELAGKQAVVAAAQATLDRAKAEAKRTPAAKVAKRSGRWQDGLRDAVRSGDFKINLGNEALDDRIRAALLDPDFTLYKLEQKAYKLSFLLIPLSLPFLALLFPFRRDVNLYDHTIFALYSLSFMSLLFIAAALAGKVEAINGIAPLLVLIAPPVHIYAQLKGTYGLTRGGALFRTFWMIIFSSIVLTLYLALILVLGVLD